MKHLLSIFSFDTLRLPRLVPLSWLLAFLLVVLAEGTARVLLHNGVLKHTGSLKGLIEGNLASLLESPAEIWLVGNSVLAYGIDEQYLSGNFDIDTAKLCHGSATVRGSAAMLDYYLQRLEYRPSLLVILVTKDDFNVAGDRAVNSQAYIEYTTWKSTVRYCCTLRSARRSIYERIVAMAPLTQTAMITGAVNDKTFDGTVNEEWIDRLARDFRIDTTAFHKIESIRKRYGIDRIAVVLMPVTDVYAEWHDRHFPDNSYNDLRNWLMATCKNHRFDLIDMGEPLTRYDVFSDSYHLNESGKELFSQVLCRKIAPVLESIQQKGGE
jgi:hypothetical protein